MWDQVRYALNQAVANFIVKLVSLLPGLVAVALAFLVSLLLAWVVGILARRTLAGMGFDQWLARWGVPPIGGSSPATSPTLLVSGSISAGIVAAGLLIGMAAFDSELTTALVRSIFAYIPDVLGAILVLLVGAIAARFLSRTVLIGAVNLNLEYARLLSAGVKWLVNVLAVAMALEHLKIAAVIVELAFGILFGGIVLALALAVGLGSKDLVTKSLERDTKRAHGEALEEPLHHL